MKFYSLNSYQFLFKFGRIGRGPSEYMVPGIYRNGPNEFILVEKLRYSLLTVDSILVRQDYVPARCNVHFGFSSVNHAGFINDSSLIYSCLVSDYQFSVTNIYWENTVNYSNYPNRIKDYRINDFISNTKEYHSQKQLLCKDIVWTNTSANFALMKNGKSFMLLELIPPMKNP